MPFFLIRTVNHKQAGFSFAPYEVNCPKQHIDEEILFQKKPESDHVDEAKWLAVTEEMYENG